MAYAFSKLDDYFRRGKTGAQGGLEKGTTGAPPPTAAANNLARTAETSAEQGNAGSTGIYRAAKGADTTAIQSRLSEPAAQQIKNWESDSSTAAQNYRDTGTKQMDETFKPYDADDMTAAEKGDQTSAGKLSSQLSYAGSQTPFQPFQVADPEIDSSSMLRGGVAGIQGALQKKGGRYTPGMAALDASVLAGDRNAVAGLQSNFGNLMQGAREQKANFEQTDENLTAEATNRADEIKNATRQALEGRLGTLQNLQRDTLASQIKTPEQLAAERQALVDSGNTLLGQRADSYGVPLDRLRSALGNNVTPGSFIREDVRTVEAPVGEDYTNLYNILGDASFAPQTITGQSTDVRLDQGAMLSELDRLIAQYAGRDTQVPELPNDGAPPMLPGVVATEGGSPAPAGLDPSTIVSNMPTTNFVPTANTVSATTLPKTPAEPKGAIVDPSLNTPVRNVQTDQLNIKMPQTGIGPIGMPQPAVRPAPKPAPKPAQIRQSIDEWFADALLRSTRGRR